MVATTHEVERPCERPLDFVEGYDREYQVSGRQAPVLSHGQQRWDAVAEVAAAERGDVVGVQVAHHRPVYEGRHRGRRALRRSQERRCAPAACLSRVVSESADGVLSVRAHRAGERVGQMPAGGALDVSRHVRPLQVENEVCHLLRDRHWSPDYDQAFPK